MCHGRRVIQEDPWEWHAMAMVVSGWWKRDSRIWTVGRGPLISPRPCQVMANGVGGNLSQAKAFLSCADNLVAIKVRRTIKAGPVLD
jgi:hypothetical protein